jgi:nucleoside-diphosphate-sugar epimerase
MSGREAATSALRGLDVGRLHVVLGAGGGTGGAIVRELVGQGRRVRAVTRGGNTAASYGTLPPASFEDVAADVTEPEQLQRALEGATVVYHCARPASTQRAQAFPAMTRGIIAATAAAGAKLVFADDLSVYGLGDGPVTEESPPAPQTKQGRVHAAMAAELLEAHRDGSLRVVIGRSSSYFGPGAVRSAIGERFFRAVLGGKKVTWFADLDQPHTMSYLPDMARAFVLLGERAEADGQVWHTPAAKALTGREFIALAARVAGTSATPGVMGLGAARLRGLFLPLLHGSPQFMEQWQRPFVMDASKFESAFGPSSVTSPEGALRTTLGWYRRRV